MALSERDRRTVTIGGVVLGVLLAGFVLFSVLGGGEEAFPPIDELLSDKGWDDGFALTDESATLSISGGRLAITVDLLEGYYYAQVYAPPNQDFVALEPMTAPTSALTSGARLALVAPGGRYRTAFRIRVETV